MKSLTAIRLAAVCGLSLAGAFLSTQPVAAFKGTGYYSGGLVCTASNALTTQNCGTPMPPYSNDVVPGRTGVTNAVPASATASKAGFYTWLSGSNASWPNGSVVGDENAHKDAARRFIVDTMNGNKNNDMAGLKSRLDNPAIKMAIVNNINPSTIGSISFYGMDSNKNLKMFYATWAGVETYKENMAIPMLVFYKDANNNGVFDKATDPAYYYIQIGCGNPVGQLPGIPVAENWTINGQSYINVANTGNKQGTVDAVPGQQVKWAHTLTNNGPTNMLQNVNYSVPIYGGYLSAGFGGATVKTPAISGAAKGNVGVKFVNTTNGDYSLYTVQPGDVGKKLCQRIDWNPSSPTVSGGSSSTEACANVHSDYNLYPHVTVGGGTTGVVVVGGTADQQSSVENTATKADVSANYQSYDFVVQAGKTIDLSTVFKDQGNGRIFALAPGVADICKNWLSGQYPAGTVTCKSQVASGSAIFNGGTSTVDQSMIDASGFRAGDLICRMLWVDHYDYSHTASTERRVSLPACVRVAKTPYVQFWGGDVRVGDSIGGATSLQSNAYTSSNLIGGKTLGSWAEYGIFAPTNGTIRSASGGALSGSNGFAGTASDTDMSHLSFANTSTPKGNWSTPANVASFENSLGLPDGGAVADGSISLSTLSNRGKVTLTNASGTVHVGGTLPSGSLMLNYPTGTVVIDSNIILGTNSFSSLAGLSQVVIQAKNIIISHDVDRVDAWLVAIATNSGTVGGVVSTCDAIVTPYYSGLSAAPGSPCNQKPLRINGPVMGREVQLRRTYGAEGDNTPAETIDLRADAYLWTMQAANNGSIDTIFTTELPPRF